MSNRILGKYGVQIVFECENEDNVQTAWDLVDSIYIRIDEFEIEKAKEGLETLRSLVTRGSSMIYMLQNLIGNAEALLEGK